MPRSKNLDELIEGRRIDSETDPPPAPDRNALRPGDLVELTMPLFRNSKTETENAVLSVALPFNSVVVTAKVWYTRSQKEPTHEVLKWEFFSSDGRVFRATWPARLVEFTWESDSVRLIAVGKDRLYVRLIDRTKLSESKKKVHHG